MSGLVTVARVTLVVLAVGAGVGYIVGELALAHVADKLRSISEGLGGG